MVGDEVRQKGGGQIMESPVDHRREFAVYSSGSGKPSPLWATPHPRIVFASDSSLHMRHLGYYQV